MSTTRPHDRRCPRLLFAVVGHNEQATVLNALNTARAAAHEGDQVVLVDSASTDQSRQVARAAGHTVWEGPLGKGAAMQYAWERCEADWLIFTDADLLSTEHNIPGLLARATRAQHATRRDMIVGDYTQDPQCPQSVGRGIAQPLMRHFYPEAAEALGLAALSGQRAVRSNLLGDRRLPIGFGVEAYLNCVAAASDDPGRITVVQIGGLENPFKYKPDMGHQVAEAIIKAAHEDGLLSAADRPEVDAWVDSVCAVIATYKGTMAERPAYMERLRAVVARPLPSPAMASA